MNRGFPRRGEIWTAFLGDAPQRHWVVIISVDARNCHSQSVLVAPFGSRGAAGPTVIEMSPAESGLPQTSFLKGHFVQVLRQDALAERCARTLSDKRLRELVLAIRRAIDPDAPFA